MSSILYNDKLYGGAITALDANHVLYDNTDFGLTSSNVQDVVQDVVYEKS